MISTSITRARLVFVPWLAVFGLALGGDVAAQQPNWQIPDETYRFDFGATKKNAPKPVFSDKGFAWEFPLALVLLKRNEITIEARLGEPGQLDFELTNPDAMVDIAKPTIADGVGRIVVQSKIAKLDREALKKIANTAIERLLDDELKKARGEAAGRNAGQMSRYLRENGAPVPGQDQILDHFVRLRAVELGKDKLRDALDELGRKRSDWLSEADRRDWKAAPSREILLAYFRLVEFDQAEASLRALGLKTDANRRNVESVLLKRLEAAHAMLTGKSIDADELTRQLIQQLSADDMTRIRQAVTLTGNVRLFPPADPKDSNAQWFNGQKVSCLAANRVTAIRVHGKLDPANHDAVDWWTLTGYAEEKLAIRWPAGAKVRHEIFSDRGQRARVRVLADQPAEYTMEIVGLAGDRDQAPIVIHESTAPADVQFPF